MLSVTYTVALSQADHRGRASVRPGCFGGSASAAAAAELQQEFGLTDLFISHSLPVVAQLASHIAVMRAGKIVEYGPAEQVLRKPLSGYTRELLAAVAELPTARLV